MPKSKRLPRRVHLGMDYVIEVVLVSQRVIRDVMELDDDDTSRFDGCWVSHLGDGTTIGKTAVVRAGIIYIDQKLSVSAKRSVYWHELDHAVNDIRSWDGEESVL